MAELTRLAVQGAADAVPFRLVEVVAYGVHADPQAGEAAEEVVDATGKEPGGLGIEARGATKGHQRVDGIGGLRRHSVGEEMVA